MRSTRSNEKKRKQDEGIVDEPKAKSMTLGKYLALERQAEEEKLMENEGVAKFEQFTNYSKDAVVAEMAATEVDGALFRDNNYYTSPTGDDVKILFLTLETGDHPKDFTHFCNNTSLRWSLQHLKIDSMNYFMKTPSVLMLFVRGEHVAGTTATSDEYKYVGLAGVQSIASGTLGTGSKHYYLYARLIFDYALSRNELLMFGENVIKCKKNKYGCSLCA